MKDPVSSCDIDTLRKTVGKNRNPSCCPDDTSLTIGICSFTEMNGIVQILSARTVKRYATKLCKRRTHDDVW